MFYSTKRLTDEIREMKEYYMKSIVPGMFEYMSADDMTIIQKTINIFDDSLELAEKQAEKMDIMDNKLDLILMLLKKG